MTDDSKVEPWVPPIFLEDDLADFASLNLFATFEKPGQCVIGDYVTYQNVTINDKTVPQFTVATQDGLVSFNGVAQMKPLLGVPPGTRVAIRYRGEGERVQQGNRIKLFDVMILRTEIKQHTQDLIQRVRDGKPMAIAPPAVIDIEALPAGDEVDPFADEAKYDPNIPPHPAG